MNFSVFDSKPHPIFGSIDIGEKSAARVDSNKNGKSNILRIAGYQELYNQLEKPKRQPLIRPCNDRGKNLTEPVNNEQNSSFESKPTVVLDLPDISTDEGIFNPVRNKRAHLLSSSDE
ncbi:hypothetical protein TNCV_3392331 [Trichonephila clavipes]|nr:hypothetical protein TNCV_3392331 [Trichonephila clavipes]